MEPLKGLILSGGAGTRLRPITHTSAKQLVPVANKPVLFYGIEALVEAGITEIGIIIAPETGDEIRDRRRRRLAVRRQDHLHRRRTSPPGLAHAVLTAEEFLGGSPFVMYLGDNLLRDGITRAWSTTFRAHGPDALILLTPVADPQSLRRRRARRDGASSAWWRSRRSPPSNLALVGVYMFSAGDLRRGPLARALLARRARDHRGDPDADRRRPAASHPHVVRGWWKDTGQLDDMLEANRLVLEELETSVEGDVTRARGSRGGS